MLNEYKNVEKKLIITVYECDVDENKYIIIMS